MAAKNTYNQGRANFICDKIADGWTLSKLCKEYSGTELPIEKTIYRWKDKYPEFREQLALAYQTHIYKQMDELRDLSEELLNMPEPSPEEIFTDEDGEVDLKGGVAKLKMRAGMIKERRDNIKIRIDAIKFSLSHLAPKLVPELKDQAKVQVGVVLPQINIISYKDEIKAIEGN